ncbi:CpsD/CapB family tyrosine-protein kinase [Bacillus solimangrovi]|uniref:non-specific protein-tyrosine kinase n=1 Tax=Bacillus solimangrovi TaxID=1305675 RepID=A0A1E5LDH3_9BACI|nr:CpsD/CapB family tyrosine-protein kinase [Bacillus solimangrovi]OEH92135.1 capsular biosynthesis protein [Bacillus solimangrovi]
MARKKNNLSSGRNLITQTDPKSPISEQYRTIRTNIQFASIDKQIKTIVVTSSNPGEGKSTTIANLAVTFAQQGKKVLLIDTDMRKSTVHYTFRLENTTGLTNVLTKQVKLLEAIKSINESNMDVLTSGPVPPNPAELLGSQSMKDLLDEAREHYDIILFDSPPLLAVTDAQILSNQCDGVILVVHSGKTAKEDAQKAKELLQTAQAKILGAVINQKKLKASNYYYYYGNN